MTGFATFPALLRLLIATWRISNPTAGTMSGIYYAGYMAAVLLPYRHDRSGRRRTPHIFCGLSSSAFGFVILAHGFWSALGSENSV
jgi:hypothetical protein